VVESGQMTAKDSRLTLRIRSELKKELENLASKESRSVAQVCEAFLQAGLIAYRREGTKYIHRLLSRQMAND
jgi:predicted transcriptional regulator